MRNFSVSQFFFKIFLSGEITVNRFIFGELKGRYQAGQELS